MDKNVNDFDIINFLNQYRVKESKDEVTRLYIEGRINKDEFMKRMKGAK